ncbi:2-iminobutanoate/2-iminopropanoate deaminase-like [Oscarella lobularis]|uniref:2-iminobutanoate/2-iminopropanoate deaminase-like n=1 Tax=Oscarella lobularis TaxID=121494 RepID=UPI003313D26A
MFRASRRVMSSAVVRRIINTPLAPEAIGPYNQAIVVDKTVYVSGQLGLDPDSGDFPGSDVECQTKQALINMGHILEAANSSFDKVVKTTVLLADINDYAKVNEIYAEYFTSFYPARAAFQAGALPKAAKVEIEAIAIAGDVIDEK